MAQKRPAYCVGKQTNHPENIAGTLPRLTPAGDDYLAALAKANLPTEPFETYLEAFRYGMPPHGGFAIGLERLLMQLLGLPNLRLATLFPRDQKRLTP
jgi:hypothetical protein